MSVFIYIYKKIKKVLHLFNAHDKIELCDLFFDQSYLSGFIKVFNDPSETRVPQYFK